MKYCAYWPAFTLGLIFISLLTGCTSGAEQLEGVALEHLMVAVEDNPPPSVRESVRLAPTGAQLPLASGLKNDRDWLSWFSVLSAKEKDIVVEHVSIRGTCVQVRTKGKKTGFIRYSTWIWGYGGDLQSCIFLQRRK